MATFEAREGLPIHYTTNGEGYPVLLIHGFAAGAQLNWHHTGIVDALVNAGRQVITYDIRGHGPSAKPHDRTAYGRDVLAGDAVALLDHLEIDSCDVVGYSMGSYISAHLCAVDQRPRRVVLAGVGAGMKGATHPVINGLLQEALLTERPEDIESPLIAAYRMMADHTGADRHALAALLTSDVMDGADLGAISVPTLVVAGSEDTLAPSPEQLTSALANGFLQIVPGDHLTACVAPELATAIIEFLS
jgi:pimeloyl-ACP methyl ester carboxylesterase